MAGVLPYMLGAFRERKAKGRALNTISELPPAHIWIFTKKKRPDFSIDLRKNVFLKPSRHSLDSQRISLLCKKCDSIRL